MCFRPHDLLKALRYFSLFTQPEAASDSNTNNQNPKELFYASTHFQFPKQTFSVEPFLRFCPITESKLVNLKVRFTFISMRDEYIMEHMEINGTVVLSHKFKVKAERWVEKSFYA
ncbi:CLUMA_CG008240, isoform A [Clunio marinus]|uniref:CLUMA_CG008240, isoform A n=1 Tax=Clunio marinus TaxID=568069 RepID=A0A1J1I578_9DIPT|nr:CLUMA_CG008240, isoform A [Clunio marinus]